ncbi:MAG: Clp protease ClpP [Ruminococcaceae bacterium]|nr:Clp protease ClpP [Oscillospiraceae bacterium]
MNNDIGADTEERTLYLDGAIAEDSWFDDDVTPELFKAELEKGVGDITVWINSPGGDCFAAAQIYNMLKDYKGKVTVKIDGIAASAASVIAMAGDVVQMSPVGMMMIHNPSTISWGDHKDMQRAIEMLDECKESIINAYERKTGLARNRLSKLMDEETWMNANKAVELGFADEIIGGESKAENSVMFSQKTVNNALVNKLCAEEKDGGRRVDELSARLDMIKNYF